MRAIMGVVVAALALAGCQKEPAAPPAAKAVSLHAVMKGQIAPGADTLWNAVGETFEGGKSVQLAPSTPAQWDALGQKVGDMRQGMTALLAAPTVTVAAAGETIQGGGEAGAPQADQIQKRLDANHAGFVVKAQAMAAILDQFDVAIKARDVKAYTELGGNLDSACEACHLQFWYPDQKPIS